MAEIKQIQIENNIYSLKDEIARNNFENYVPITQKGVANGIATLGEDSKILSSQLPTMALGIPSGSIFAWYGDLDFIPEGYVLCDGENNTPDLRGRFILGANEAYPFGEIGGEEEHTLTIDEMPSHTHEIERGSIATSGSSYSQGSGNKENLYTNETGGDQPHNNMPPYYSLYYIMKI